jgi:septal ring factor EnvC (AmiA/AmiB activator)
MNTDVVEYSVTDAVISKMSADYMKLTIKGLDDKPGFSMVHSARMVVKGKRLEVEKKRKELKADALAWGQKVDAEARRITKLLEPIETHLEMEENKITEHKKRLEAESKRKQEEQAQARVDQMARVGVSLAFLQAMEISEGDFQARLIIATDEYNKEQARIADEKRKEVARLEAERKAREEESARLVVERAEIERIRAEEDTKRKSEEARLKKEREAIEAERRKVEDDRREQEHREAIARAEKEAAERAVIEAKEKAEREAREKAEAEAKAKAEADRQEALRPDKEKLVSYAARIMAATDPALQSDEAKLIYSEAYKKLLAVNRYIIKAAQDL